MKTLTLTALASLIASTAHAEDLTNYQVAGGGIAGFILLLTIASIVYAIACFLIPFMLGATMHNTKNIQATLQRIERLLEQQARQTEPQEQPRELSQPVPEFGTEEPKPLSVEAWKKLHLPK